MVSSTVILSAAKNLGAGWDSVGGALNISHRNGLHVSRENGSAGQILMSASLARKAAAVMLLLSALVSVYVLAYVMWSMSGFPFGVSFDCLDLTDFWIPVAGCVVTLTLASVALPAVLRGRGWWLAVIGSIFAPVAPFVWQLFPVTRDPIVVIPRAAGIPIGLAAIVLVLISRRAFEKRANR